MKRERVKNRERMGRKERNKCEGEREKTEIGNSLLPLWRVYILF